MSNSDTPQKGEKDFDKWRKQPRPNYGETTNTDMKFPYSEHPRDCPDEYGTVELPRNQHPAEILDFWGEGRIRSVDSQGKFMVTGFPQAYNVHHQFQLVSNGPDEGKKIPNRIPTRDYDNVSVAKYVPSGSFHTITVMNDLMTSRLPNATAAEVARIISGASGSTVVIYGYSERYNYSDFFAFLMDQLDEKRMVLMPHYELPSPLNEITLTPALAFRNVDTVLSKALSNFEDGNMLSCAEILISLHQNSKSSAVKALRSFFSGDTVRSSYKIFSLGDKLNATAGGQKVMDQYMNDNVKKMVKSDDLKLKFKATLGETSYLCVNDKMGSGSTYEWAFFGTSSYINDKSRYRGGEYFSLVPNGSKTQFQIKSSHGYTSYLCTNRKVTSNNYQYAFFGTPSYLSDPTYSNGQWFYLIPSSGGETFQVQATFGEPSYLCVNHHVEIDNYRYAFFGTSDYIDSDTSYSGGQHFTPVFQ